MKTVNLNRSLFKCGSNIESKLSYSAIIRLTGFNISKYILMKNIKYTYITPTVVDINGTISARALSKDTSYNISEVNTPYHVVIHKEDVLLIDHNHILRNLAKNTVISYSKHVFASYVDQTGYVNQIIDNIAVSFRVHNTNHIQLLSPLLCNFKVIF